ncbi:MAG: HAD-IIIC family phosphatase [Pseudomonadota bacterium]
MSQALIQLPWLPEAPEDFTKQCREFGSTEGPAGAMLQFLAGHRMSLAQAGSLSRAIAKRRRAGADFAPLAEFSLSVLTSSTIDILIDYIPAAAARHGVVTRLIVTPYDQVVQQALDPMSEVNAAKADAVLLVVDHRWLQIDRPRLGDGADQVSGAIRRLDDVVKALRQNGGGPAIIQTIAVPPTALFGSFERRVSGSVRSMVEEINRLIVDLADRTQSYILDAAALAERVGTDLWFDPVQWAAYKLPFSSEVAPAYADLVGRLLGAIRGKARKCLVMDLDNTLWGGVVGDDGLEGIKIGQGSVVGEAHLGVQQMALDLRERGVILAVSSKNDDDVARRPFQEHPDMALKEQHISVFQANWLDKASNLEAIARSLNIGIDALVLLDDNPAERAQLRAALPAIAVPELPNEPSLFVSYLLAAGYFETIGFTAEDRLRAGSYKADAERAAVMATTRDLGDYLQSLGMTMRATPFDLQGRKRIAQLIGKTNQFNLTTRRHSEAEVARFEADPDAFTLQVRLEDKFGDLGMIGVVICTADKYNDRSDWHIDTWLMSCRVLGRKVEEAMLGEIARGAMAKGVKRLVGIYIPTVKNGMVADHYQKLGFRMAAETDGHPTFVLELGDYTRPSIPIEIIGSDALSIGPIAPLMGASPEPADRA